MFWDFGDGFSFVAPFLIWICYTYEFFDDVDFIAWNKLVQLYRNI